MTRVWLEDKTLYVSAPFSELAAAQGIPQRRWSKAKTAWACRPSLANMQYIMSVWPSAEWTAEATNAFKAAREMQAKRDAIRDGLVSFDFSQIRGPFKKPQFEWQKKVHLLARDLPEFAIFADQGTGKTKALIDDAAYNYRKGRIDAMLVFAPNDVKTNWVAWPGMLEPGEVDAISDHMADDVLVTKGLWLSQPGKWAQYWKNFEDQINNHHGELIVLAVNYDALNVQRAFDFLEEFCKRFKVMIVCDESTEIKTPGSKRSKAAKKLRKLCKIARIASGTPVIKRPLDAYSQFEFLNEDILGFGSFFSFKSHFAVTGGFKNKQVIKYVRLDELEQKIASCSYRVTKEECFDLPPKQFQKIRVDMSDEQLKAYKQMREELMAETKDGVVTATIAITQVMRLSQITGGYISERRPDANGKMKTHVIELVPPGRNPKMQAVMRLLEEAGDQQGIIWAHWRPQIEGMATLFRHAGVRFAEFHGGVDEAERLRIRKDFKAKKIDWIIANQACGARGIDEFKTASIVIYLSNSESTEDRIQSEDRTHRHGMQPLPCNYYDIVVPNTVDVRTIQTLRANKQLSDQIMRDGIREWI